MNNWGNDYGMPNQYGMPPSMTPMPNMMPNMMQPLVPPMCMMSELGHPNPPPPGPLIGPVMPSDNVSNHSNDVQIMEDVSDDNKRPQQDDHSQNNKQQGGRNQQSRFNNNRDNNRRDRNFDRDRSRRRSRSRDRNPRGDRSRDRNDRNDRNQPRNDRRRDRPSKWNKNDDNAPMNPPVPLMPGMMPMMMNNNMMNNNMMHGHQPMDMGNMPNMGSMGNMMPGMNMMPNMMPNMMDPNMMMMNQPFQPNQPIFFSTGVLLPPLPGTSMPNRREKPPGCRTIFVGGLPNIIVEDVVAEIFQRFGPITDVKLHRQGVCHVRFDNIPSVEQSFLVSGFRFKLHEQTENEATTIFVDYALNRDDQNEYERNKRHRQPTPPRIEPFNPTTLTTLTEKIKNDDEFSTVAPTLHGWLERGECTKKYANTFYSLIQAANNQVRRLFNDKMQVDEEFQTIKTAVKEKYLKIITQFEQVAKILSAAKHQRVSDHFTKQQRRNIEMWLKMTEEVDNIKDEYNIYFDEEETENKIGKNAVPLEKYEELKTENENLMFELEGYRNEAHLAKDEAERKFEKFKAQFIAQQALQNPNSKQVFPPLPPPPMPVIMEPVKAPKPEPPPPTPDDMKLIKSGQLPVSDAKLISVLTAFLLVHPLGATVDYMASYVRSMLPGVNHGVINNLLQRYPDVFRRKTTGIGPNIEHKWEYVTFDAIKKM